MQNLPAGWSMDQLQAINELPELVDKFNLVKTIRAATGDNTPEAVKVQADILDLARARWASVKSYPPAE